MSQTGLSLDEELQSQDLFSDPETVQSPEAHCMDESNSTLPGIGKPEPMDEVPEWKGISMDEIYKGLGPYGYDQQPPIHPSELHTVLFLLPLTGRGPPKAYPAHRTDQWNVGYVRMPHSSHSLYPIEQQPGGTREFRLRWEVIQEKLLQSFVSSAQLEAAVLSYNKKYAERWDFRALHHFFSDIAEEEAGYFFANLLPKIIQLALQLPTLVTGAIPLLKQHTNGSVSFSQLQVASLLANAFLCTFPRRNSTNPHSEYAAYPRINFDRLFGAYRQDKPDRSEAVAEKLKCIFHYFRRVTTKAPEGTITIQRRYIPKEDCPKWDKLDHRLPLLHITSKGTIETEGAGLLQVDFANRFVGGGVLHWGCVQEEIRFIICPELMVAMLVTESLDNTEALIVSGIERYSKYEGYSTNFTWAGDYVDETPRDNSGRRRTSVVAIDALCFWRADTQFTKENMLRELNKAYVGFSSAETNKDNLPAIATGNWGCGAFRGNPKLKVLLQLMAAAVAGRSMVYFTFGDTDLRDSVADMYWHLVQRNMDIAQLFSLLSQYENASSSTRSDFYHFLYKRSKMKPLTKYFTILKESIEDSNCRGKKWIEGKRETAKESRLLTGSVATQKEKYEEDTIIAMLEKSEKSDLEKSTEEEQRKPDNKKEPLDRDQEFKERSKFSLFDALKEQESKSIAGSRKSEFDLASTTKDNSPVGNDSPTTPTVAKDHTLVENGSQTKALASPGSAISSIVKKKKSTEKKGQTKIQDFFPRRTS